MPKGPERIKIIMTVQSVKGGKGALPYAVASNEKEQSVLEVSFIRVTQPAIRYEDILIYNVNICEMISRTMAYRAAFCVAE